MKVKQKYSDMLIVACDKLNAIGDEIALKEDNPNVAWKRPYPIVKTDAEAYRVLMAMSIEYSELQRYLYVLNLNADKFDEHMDSIFRVIES